MRTPPPAGARPASPPLTWKLLLAFSASFLIILCLGALLSVSTQKGASPPGLRKRRKKQTARPQGAGREKLLWNGIPSKISATRTSLDPSAAVRDFLRNEGGRAGETFFRQGAGWAMGGRFHRGRGIYRGMTALRPEGERVTALLTMEMDLGRPPAGRGGAILPNALRQRAALRSSWETEQGIEENLCLVERRTPGALTASIRRAMEKGGWRGAPSEGGILYYRKKGKQCALTVLETERGKSVASLVALQVEGSGR